MDSYAVGSRSQANDARSEARPDMLGGVVPPSLMLGEVLGASEAGYRVATYDADGNVEQIFPRVLARGEVELAEGATVLLSFEMGPDNPEIVVVSGGGGGCGGSFHDFGVLMR